MEENKIHYDSLILHIKGGAGKNIMATAVTKAYRKQYPTTPIIVVSFWEDIWLNNTDIDRVYSGNKVEYFYDDHVKGKNPYIVINDPYDHQDYIKGKTHLIKVWCEMCNCEYDNEQPVLTFNKAEIKNFETKFKPNKPIFFLQTTGGPADQGYSWSRDIPTDEVIEIVKQFTDEYEFFHMRLDEHPEIFSNSTPDVTRREWLMILQRSEKRLLIDSLCQHAAAALNLPSTVCWIGNDPKLLGYDIHDNIPPQANEFIETNKYSYVSRFDLAGISEQCPYKNEQLFNTDEIIKSIKNQ